MKANDGHTYCHQCTWNDVPEDKQCVAWLPGRCRNAAVRDGYCGEHHPDAPVRREITREENEFLRGLVRELTAALINGAPIEALQDKCPLVLYFGNPADRDELVAAIKAIKTNFVEVKLPPEKV